MRRMEAEFAADLALTRPDLSAAYVAALPGARAAILGRLWRSLLYEPLPGLADVPRPDWRGLPGLADVPPRTGPDLAAPVAVPPPDGRGLAGPGLVEVPLADGRRLAGRARGPYDLDGEPALWLDGRPYTHPAELLAALALPGTAGLVGDLDNGVASLALSRAEPARTPATPEEHEQSVVDGHPYHPGCRTRPGLSVEEQLAYMPEHRPTVRLDLLAVPAADCLVSGSWPAHLTDGDRLLLPVHPWQSAHVLPGLGLRPHVTGAVPARPLMSARTLAPVDGGPHVKTALSTRLTSAVRDLSPGSVRDCVHLSDLLTTLAARLGGRPRVARYLAGAAARVNGAFSPDLAAMWREPAGAAIPVAAVTSAMVRDPRAWLAAFARLALRDALGLLALGVALEAHGQNLLVEPGRDGLPARLVYRDLADVRISPARLARHGVGTPPVSARLLADDPGTLHAKLYGGLVGTTFGSLIALFCRRDRAAESRLWDVVAAAARDAFDELPGTKEDRAALFGPHLTAKAHLLARLEGAPPGDSWTRLPNPLAG
ncbi:IucA/IucC family siderophore biosynthesis protein [Nonomuraea phyllanthi]|uniref:IucA/IucC family siderophore biosynthesis protein n=2 Tax=Nonomuraea phyllanthi TaxID=2219224 RepID=A0A5C4WTL1_9ACTN|nr:IucA/IucC family siderophore biosynthesis protein [Nonomuraea phyllanthi]QFY15024.1 IucA/IucC family siderophore biosynthesis protein [Nonomuraea phyllanthi]